VPISRSLNRLCIVLVSTRNPLNIGAAARAMCNFGVSDLRVVHPYDPAFHDARSAVGAEAVLENARSFETVADAVADCTLVVGTAAAMGRRTRQPPLRPLVEGVPLILAEIAAAPARRAAILFGSEKTGLSNRDLSHCHWQMYIPTAVDQPSMNLGQAVAVCLYELSRRQSVPPQPHDAPPASSGDLERLTAVLLESLEASGYFDPQTTREDRLESLRRMILRLHPSAEDAVKALGMLRQILWKLR
jgi:tRNA/rRNA methyltransferase